MPAPLPTLPPLRARLRERSYALIVTTLTWRGLVDLLLFPALLLLLRGLLFLSGNAVLADADLISFAMSPYGALVVLFVLVAGLGLAIAGHALALLVLAAPEESARVSTLGALSVLRSRARGFAVLVLRILLRVSWLALPFVVVTLVLLREILGAHDINYYLDAHPPEFWLAVGLSAVVLGLAAMVLLAQFCAWAMALPLFLFEGLSAPNALQASEVRTRGRRKRIFVEGAAAVGVIFLTRTTLTMAWLWIAQSCMGWCATDMRLLLVVTTAWLLGAAGLDLILGALGYGTMAVMQLRWYAKHSTHVAPWLHLPVPQRRSLYFLPLSVLAATGVSFAFSTVALFRVHPPDDCLIIAHRGASAVAPENTLAAVRAAIAANAEMVEIDVQESKDGAVVVIHDRDLARVGGTALSVDAATAAELRAIDIGARRGAAYVGERVPLLDEVLELAKDRIKVLIELKRYGSGGELPERVVASVERLGMQAQIACMSLDADLVARLRRLRPTWSVGTLAAVSVGGLEHANSSFVAVRLARVDRAFVERMHRYGKQVYVWTINDAVGMARAFSLGVDGIITDHPELVRAARTARSELEGVPRALAHLAGFLAAPQTPEDAP